jgi:hypothetical protein
MQDQNDANWTPPPPPDDSIFSSGTRAYYADEISKGATKALIFGILSILCCPPIFAYLGYTTAQEVMANIDVYQIGEEKRGLAQAGKVLSIIGVVLWVLGLIVRVTGIIN